ncbi:MAG: hypothetical protein LC798_15410 [Chloroflexi bacterium]|nr:hypothetical protein [Chloroflexota bacterium]
MSWMFAALDRADDTTIPRDQEARDTAVAMAGMVFADIGDDMSVGALVSNVLRAVTT